MLTAVNNNQSYFNRDKSGVDASGFLSSRPRIFESSITCANAAHVGHAQSLAKVMSGEQVWQTKLFVVVVRVLLRNVSASDGADFAHMTDEDLPKQVARSAMTNFLEQKFDGIRFASCARWSSSPRRWCWGLERGGELRIGFDPRRHPWPTLNFKLD